MATGHVFLGGCQDTDQTMRVQLGHDDNGNDWVGHETRQTSTTVCAERRERVERFMIWTLLLGGRRRAPPVP
jgi:hypothetical protein